MCIYKEENTNFSEAIRFYRGFLKKDFESITRQAIGKQRKYILPDLYKDIFLCFVDNLYDKFKGFSKINGYIVAAGDTSVCDLPSDRKLKEKMGVKKNLKSWTRKIVELEFLVSWMFILRLL